MRLGMGAGGGCRLERFLDEIFGHDRIALAVVAGLAHGDADLAVIVFRDEEGLDRGTLVVGGAAHFLFLSKCLGSCGRRSAPPERAATRRAARAWGLLAVDEAALGEIVGGHLDMDTVSDDGADAKAPHLSRRIDDHAMIVIQTNPEAAVGQDLVDQAFDSEESFLGHISSLNPCRRGAYASRAKKLGGEVTGARSRPVPSQ